MNEWAGTITGWSAGEWDEDGEFVRFPDNHGGQPMSRHVCEVWAEQGWCPHTRPSFGARLAALVENIEAGIVVNPARFALPDCRTLESLLNPFSSKS